MKLQAPSHTLPILFAAAIALSTTSRAQELPFSGATGFDFFYATSPIGETGFFATNIRRSTTPFQFGPTFFNEPSTWAHRRRTMGGLETNITSPERGVFVTPMGNGPGNGALHLVDMRGTVQTALIPTGNPAAYDVAFHKGFKYVFSAEDDGSGQTILRGFSYASLGTLTPLTPASLTLPGAPASYVNRIGVDIGGQLLHVPTATGVQVVTLSAAAPQMTAGAFISCAPAAPATNPILFSRNGTITWVLGTTTFSPSNPLVPSAAGFLSWDASGASSAAEFGVVPTAPAKKWVPAVGTEELAVVSNGTDAYAYFLLREPGPGTFFVKPSSVGAVRFLGNSAPTVGTILVDERVGEPFSIPSTFGTRVAFESSFGPPFTANPPGGGEVISILYSPLDTLGASSAFGVLGVPDPLGGRISTKGLERPIWSQDGTRVFACTSHFPGAPNPGIPGIEALNVPADQLVDQYTSPHMVTPNLPFPNQAIVFPSNFRPRSPSAAGPFAGLSFFGCVFNQGVASIAAPTYGEYGQLQLDPMGFTLLPSVPDFPSILPATFDDVHSSLVVVPVRYGARRTTFNYAPTFGFSGLNMSAAMNDRILVQMTGVNFLAALGLALPMDTQSIPLPSGWITTSEFYSL
ncbi:MAG: hypothetical protein IPJ77_09970 [Planctomycetes bacterium]|nr:hypothetical protein [Planctomycetota bacterium]